jgi:hypothetical protein
MMRTVTLLMLALAGCGGYIGTGPAPQVGVPRSLSLDIEVKGDEKSAVEEALRWVLDGNHALRRVRSGGDARVTISGKLKQDRAILAGTDCTFSVQLTALSAGGDELVRETREFKAAGLQSNVWVETEKLITKGVVWAIERTGSGLAAPPPPPPPPAAEPVTPPPTVDEESPPLQPATPVRKKPRPRRR